MQRPRQALWGLALTSAVIASAGEPLPPLLALPLRASAAARRPAPPADRRGLAGVDSAAAASGPAYPLSGGARDQGVFTVPLSLGSPPQTLEAIVDTGSTLTAFTCAGCPLGECGTDHGVFDPEASATATRLACDDAACECGSPACACGEAGQCAYRRMYAESSSTSGVMVVDGLSLPPGLGGGNATASTARLAFGCATKETGSIHAQPAAGIAGLGADGVGFVDQLAAAGVLARPAFSLCLAPPGEGGAAPAGGGALLLGPGLPAGVAGGALISTPLVPSKGAASFYSVALRSLALGGPDAPPLPTNPPQPGLWGAGHGVVLDSGTTFTFLPSPAYKALVGAVGDAAAALGGERVPGPDPAFPDACWGGLPTQAGAWAGAALPNVTLVLGGEDGEDGGAPLTLPPRNYLFPHPARAGAACLGVFDNGGAGTILGGITFLDVLVQLDRDGGGAAGGTARFVPGVDCGALGSAAAVGLREAGLPVPSAGAPPGPAPRPWGEIAIAAASLAALGLLLASLFACRRRLSGGGGMAPPPEPDNEPGGSARWWVKWPNWGGAAPALPARWWWMAGAPAAPSGAAGRQWEAFEGEGHADMALGLGVMVPGGAGSGIVVTPAVGDEVELGRVGRAT